MALHLDAVIGFAGAVPAGLRVHPDRETLLYPLGTNVIVESIHDRTQQTFLQGHSGNVTCIAVSKSGRYIASGQETSGGFNADVIIWDFVERKELKRLSVHKMAVASLAFSPSDKFLVSLGGPDDDKLNIWDVATGKALFNKATSNGRGGAANTVTFASQSDHIFVVGGNDSLRVWEINSDTHKALPFDVVTREIRRDVTSLAVSDDDSVVYAGTRSGDIMEFGLTNRLLKNVGPDRAKFAKGVTAMSLLKNGDLLVGSGNGTVALVNPVSWKTKRSAKVVGSVMSVTQRGDGHELFVGTSQNRMYRIDHAEFACNERLACPSAGVYDVVFPKGTSELFATCSGPSITMWHTPTSKELLTITVPNKICNCVAFTPNGSLVLSGWNDGAVRCFLPETGKCKFELFDAAGKGVTALIAAHDGRRFLTGAQDSQIRIWRILQSGAELEGVLSEHSGKITSLMINETDEELVSSSYDGTCIIWDLKTLTRSQIIMANTLFTAIKYRPDEAQVLTVGTDRKVAYWEVFDGSMIREVEIAKSGAINCLDIAASGEMFVAGGSDKLVKVISYSDAERVATGNGHGGNITAVKVCPNMRYIVSVSEDGAICRWSMP